MSKSYLEVTSSSQISSRFGFGQEASLKEEQLPEAEDTYAFSQASSAREMRPELTSGDTMFYSCSDPTDALSGIVDRITLWNSIAHDLINSCAKPVNSPTGYTKTDVISRVITSRESDFLKTAFLASTGDGSDVLSSDIYDSDFGFDVPILTGDIPIEATCEVCSVGSDHDIPILTSLPESDRMERPSLKDSVFVTSELLPNEIYCSSVARPISLADAFTAEMTWEKEAITPSFGRLCHDLKRLALHGSCATMQVSLSAAGCSETVHCSALVDSGASLNCINLEIWSKLGKPVTGRRYSPLMADGRMVDCESSTLLVEYKCPGDMMSHHVRGQFMVVPGCPVECILGMPWLKFIKQLEQGALTLEPRVRTKSPRPRLPCPRIDINKTGEQLLQSPSPRPRSISRPRQADEWKLRPRPLQRPPFTFLRGAKDCGIPGTPLCNKEGASFDGLTVYERMKDLERQAHKLYLQKDLQSPPLTNCLFMPGEPQIFALSLKRLAVLSLVCERHELPFDLESLKPVDSELQVSHGNTFINLVSKHRDGLLSHAESALLEYLNQSYVLAGDTYMLTAWGVLTLSVEMKQKMVEEHLESTVFNLTCC
eukprot:Blabericola_migrator_1__5226@NODE_268_length_10573_cov_173_829050_g224_i0_p2_GENE_NODE_268_length_10573_cov_173_829050_g224_i0NODE_268_length_10573_cov_173_829050_g224_i0_p2_ORF_typecomplete_len598_score33_87RVP_2/PF08284_11/7_3e11gagasp_proteas/PF13975_6/3_4e10RVP/PF00077_20/2_7e07Asp_protease/PF09668_10/9_3e07Asp_protease_2/PF13650_6/1_6e06Peptidase_A2B/PF12384_8/0_0033Peptidase_A3/PF02160_15/0_37_NODE_268_length_10573_cov_173_829050_g224_i034315224